MAFGSLPEMIRAADAGMLTDFVGSALPVSDDRGHPVEIIGATLEPIKDNKGQMVKLDYRIFDGPHKDTIGSERFMMYYADPNKSQDDNAKVSKIQRENFFKVLHCVGLGFTPIQALNVLSGKRFCVIVGLQKEPNPEKYTEIKAHTALDGSRPYLGPNGAAPQQAQAQVQAQPQMQQTAPAQGGAWGGQPAPQNQPQSAPQGGGWGNPAPAQQAQPQAQPQQSAGGWGQPSGGQPVGGNGGWG